MINSSNTSSLLHKKLFELSRNLWWTWHPEVIQIFRSIDPDCWRAVNHNPVAFLQDISPEKIAEHIQDTVLMTRIDHSFRELNKYLVEKYPWAATHAPVLQSHPVAYFSAEFGIHESLPIYSGGLGVLAGDHLKSASDIGIPMIGIGLLYREGYFTQRINGHGWQEEDYYKIDVDRLPLQPVRDQKGEPIIIEIDTRKKIISAMLWEAQVGRARLLLLDTDFSAQSNGSDDMRRLYGGDARTRIEQEMILGIGGMQALKKVGITPSVLHLNEGHCAFATLEFARQLMQEDGLSFADAAREAASRSVFTTHTPVEAGHDRFAPELVEEYLGNMRQEMNLTTEEFLALGRVKITDPAELFCMTVLALRMSKRANAVSAIHGRVSRKMWHEVYPTPREDDVPIGHITNGVHALSWIAQEMYELFDRTFGYDWPKKLQRPELWEMVECIDPAQLWEVRHVLKSKLIAFARKRLLIQKERNEVEDLSLAYTGEGLQPDTLTIGFSRRFAAYKRANLLLTDTDRFFSLLTNPERPVQLVFSGKAHPKDEVGKRMIQQIMEFARDPRTAGRIVFLEGYDMNVARHIVQGVDLWLNNPRKPLEACGTSGMKCIFNGVLNFSILDGWWAEAYDGRNGFAIGYGGAHKNTDIQDFRDAELLYTALEENILPLYYNRDSTELPNKWLEFIKRALRTLGWRFNSDRMMIDYIKKCYLPAACGEQAS